MPASQVGRTLWMSWLSFHCHEVGLAPGAICWPTCGFPGRSWTQDADSSPGQALENQAGPIGVNSPGFAASRPVSWEDLSMPRMSSVTLCGCSLKCLLAGGTGKCSPYTPLQGEPGPAPSEFTVGKKKQKNKTGEDVNTEPLPRPRVLYLHPQEKWSQLLGIGIKVRSEPGQRDCSTCLQPQSQQDQGKTPVFSPSNLKPGVKAFPFQSTGECATCPKGNINITEY